MAASKILQNTSFLIVIVCLSVSSGNNGDVGTVNFNNNLNDEHLKTKKIAVRSPFEADIFNENTDECNCGNFSIKCEYQKDLKICTCKEGYVPGINEICTEMCSDDKKCQNGGTCHNGLCICPPRTTGLFCEQITVTCWRSFLYEEKAAYRGLGCCCPDRVEGVAECKYDTKKFTPFCECPKNGDVYDDESKSCKECNCGKSGTWNKCDFYNGVKTCFCKQFYEYNFKTQTCEACNCGDNSKECKFSWNGNIKCFCKKGFKQYKNTCLKCDCGSAGFCDLSDGSPTCHCNKGSQEIKGSCIECDCGKFGKCDLDDSGKKVGCNCDTGYSDKAGQCDFCYCGDNANCSFTSDGNKTCECPHGFREIYGFCQDIDECEENNACPPSEKCVNFPGSYICACADGYRHTNEGCTDIDECLMPDSCKGSKIECVNTPGSYECRCRSGYLAQGGSKNSLVCESNSASKIGYGILGTVFAAIVIGLLILVFKKYRAG